MPAIATLKVSAGPIDVSVFTTAPWSLWGLQFPGYGSPPTYAQFDVEVLQPPNVDGNRFRIGGAHYPEFQLVGIIPAADFPSAGLLARELERTKGCVVEFQYTRDGSNPYSFWVKEAKCSASAARILGATATGSQGAGGPAPTQDAGASVDVSMVLQYFTP